MADDQFTGEMVSYRPVSGLAVAALLAGCSSALVLFTSLAAVVPLVAVVVSVAALAELRRAEGRKVGRLAALAGLALAIGFTAQAIAGGLVDRWIAGRRAEATARAWIDAVREERFAEALGMSSPAALPAPSHDPFSKPPSDAERLATFRALPTVAALAACGDSRPAVSVERDSAVETGWVARAALDGCGRQGESLTLRVEPRPSARGRELIDRWLVTGFELGR
ncbi:MAG: hypothetical protein ACKOCX_06755 [Planctomycetota bacterium]